MEVRVFGPFEACVEGRPLALGAGKPRAVLAILALNAGTTVSVQRLIEGLWGERPPATAAKLVQLYVSQVRRALAEGGDGTAVLTRGRGYELRLSADAVDAGRFSRLIAAGRPREALALWRGAPLDDLADEPFAAAEIRRLDGLRLDAFELAIERDLEAGRHREVVVELETLVREEPLRERLHAQRMLALYRSGRQADALEAYRQARSALVEQIGVEPGQELVALQRAMLAHDPALTDPDTDEPLPTGVVTFLLTDIEGSTRLWDRRPQAMTDALQLHDELTARTVEANHGHLLKSKGEGDATLSVFHRASDAILCATELQAAVAHAPWPAGCELHVRIAVHTGEAHEREGDYFGPAVNRAARLRALARGGTTVISQATAELVRDRLPPGLMLTDLGEHKLRGISRPERVLALRPEGAATTVPAIERSRLPLPRPLASASESPFVGRDKELGRLRELKADGVRVVIVAGEAGIGKTRLAGELARGMAADGADVLYGRCDEGVAVPYQPFLEALRPVALTTAMDHVAPDLARLWPELETHSEPAPADPETERYRLFEAVSALVEAATRDRPALLILDDLHWAAQPTLLMLRHLVRSDRPLRAFTVGTCRETDLKPDHPLMQLLADLQRDGSTAWVRIGGLDEHAIGALLEMTGRTPDARTARFVQRLHTETGGNPFFIREVLAHLGPDLPAAQLEMPEGLRDVLRERVARLSAIAQRALGVAAVVGPAFSLGLLERVLDDDHGGVLNGLDEAALAGLLVELGPGRYAFAHALVRQAIYEGHSSARRMRLHRRVGEALEALPDADASVEALAHHFAEAAADGQRAKAIGYSLSAGRLATLRLAYEDAAANFERGLAAAPDDDRCGELLLALADARWNSGQIDEAREACGRAAELAITRGDAEQLALAALGFAGPVRLEVAPAVVVPLMGWLERALEALDETESTLRARCTARLAAARAYADPSRRMPELAHEALAIARRLGDERAIGEVLASTYVATRGPDNPAELGVMAAELAHIAADIGDRRLSALARSWTITDRLERGDVDGAKREITTLQEEAEALKRRFPRFLAAVARAGNAHLEGRLQDYEALSHEVLAEGQDEAATHAFAAQTLFLRREQGRLGELVDAVADFADRYPEIPAWRYALAWVYAELDRPEDARRQLEKLAAEDFSDLPRDWLWLMSLASVAEVVAYLNDRPRAETLYELLVPYSDRLLMVDVGFCLGSVSRPLGRLATTTGRFAAAVDHFERALEANTRIGSRLWVAHTQYEYALTLMQMREHKKALALLRPAVSAAADLGLEALAQRALCLQDQVQTIVHG
jgi:DNA-binding SARP family transcriptional activator/tetratricopeptide (TPR) repeat protein